MNLSANIGPSVVALPAGIADTFNGSDSTFAFTVPARSLVKAPHRGEVTVVLSVALSVFVYGYALGAPASR